MTGELVTVKTATIGGVIGLGRGGGYAMISLYKGAILPPDVSEASIAHHLASGLIEVVTE